MEKFREAAQTMINMIDAEILRLQKKREKCLSLLNENEDEPIQSADKKPVTGVASDISKILEATPEGMTYTELVKASGKPRGAVYAALKRRDDIFEQNREGKWLRKVS